MKDLNGKRPSGLALIPFAVFIVIYMGAGIYYQVKGADMAFYQFPSVTAMFLAVLTAFYHVQGQYQRKIRNVRQGRGQCGHPHHADDLHSGRCVRQCCRRHGRAWSPR